MGTQGIGVSPVVQIRLEQITFLSPHFGADGITGMLLPNRRKPGNANRGKAGKGKSEPEGWKVFAVIS